MSKDKQPKVRKPEYVGAKKFWCWESRELSDAAFNFLMGYVVFFCTDVLIVDPLIVGTLFAVSKVIDGVTDILAGYIVDRTNTRWGRGRPYDVCLIGAWLSVIMIFCTPHGWTTGVKIAWVVGWYILANSVFYTFLNAGEGVFMLRAFNRDQMVKMSTQGAVATSLMGLLCGIFVPQLINAAGKNPSAWLRAVIIIAIPMTVFGLFRMLFVKEENDSVDVVAEKVKTDLKEIFRMMGRNKYWMLYCTISLVGMIVSNMGVTVYYFDKVLGNMGLQSIFAGMSALAVVALFILPSLLKRFHLAVILKMGCVISLVLNLLCFIFYKNVPILVVCYVLNMFATLPSVYASGLILYDAALFNEFLGLNRMEGTMSSMRGFCRRAGGALGTFLLGVLLKLIQYDPTAAALAPVTEFGLRFAMYGLPAVSAVIQWLLWVPYDLEKRMPEIKAVIAQRNAETTETA